jgi:cysteine desulfuration protein SufE
VKSIQEIQEEITGEFELYDDWMDKYNYLIELSRDLPLIDPKLKVKENLINGCQSKVWLDAEYRNGILYFTADSDAIITKGIISLLIRVLSGRDPGEVMIADLWFIDRIGLRQNLSPTRSNGLLSMIKQMKLYALAYQTRSLQKEELTKNNLEQNQNNGI